MRAVLRHLALLALIAAACTSSPEPPDAPGLDFASGATPPEATAASPSSEPEIEPDVGTPSDLTRVGGRLAVIDAPGNLVTMSPQGSDRVVVAEVDPGSTQIQQPAWSPDGGRLAWVHVEATGDGAFDASIASAGGEGGRPSVTPMTTVPFFLSWDPTSSRVAYLGPLPDQSIEFGVVEVAGRGEATAVDDGAPFYVSWAPSGDELLVHVGGERLDRLGIDGRARSLGEAPGTFNVPVWSGDSLVYATSGDGGERLVSQDAASGDLETLVDYEGSITFVVSPDGERVAFQVFGEEEASALSVLDLASGEVVDVIDTAIATYFWSPDGERLLYLEPVDDAGQVWFRWGVWDGDASFSGPLFVPSRSLLQDYLPFFEQYAQAISLWSPDGRAFAYPGQNQQGETGIWVQEARPNRAPVLVSDGSFVTWSPA